MKKILCFLLLLLLICPAAMAGEIVELPINLSPGLPPQADGYIYEEGLEDPIGYEDPSISVHLTRGRYLDTSWLAAKVRVATPAQVRTAMSSGIGDEVVVVGPTVARKNKTVFAINGDYFSARSGGYLVRQGRRYRMNCHGGHDVLIIDDKGDLHVIPKATNTTVKAFEGTVINSFTFGPCLIIDGQKRTDEDYVYFDVGMYKKTQRMAICQTGPLEYLCVCCEGPENNGSLGLTMDEFTDLLLTFDGIQIAYNLDGGSSSTAVFQDKNGDYYKINSQDSKIRPIKDLLYFASAWQPGADDTETPGFTVADPAEESFLVTDD